MGCLGGRFLGILVYWGYLSYKFWSRFGRGVGSVSVDRREDHRFLPFQRCDLDVVGVTRFGGER